MQLLPCCCPALQTWRGSRHCPPPPPPVPAVSCLAFTCHFNLVPVQCSLKDPSSGHMLRVLQLALAVCAAVYATVAVCGEWRGGGEHALCSGAEPVQWGR